MRFASRSRAVLGALLLAARLESSGTTMIFEEPPCGDKTESLCRALRNPDPAFRIAETRAVLAEALKSEDPAVLPAVSRAMGKLKYRIDLRPYADLLGTGCGKDASRCLWQPQDADLALLNHGSRAERLDVLERVIRDGSSRLEGGTTVRRPWALKMAAEQGLEELRPLAEEYLATLTEQRTRKLGLTNALALFELCAGSASLEDAPRWAARRIRAFPDDEFATRMTSDEGFRSAVLESARNVCQVDPLREGIAPECASVVAVADRSREAPLATGAVSHGDPCWGRNGDDWRETLWCQTRQGARSHTARPPQFEPLAEAAAFRRGDYRRGGLDPCSIPDLVEREGWVQGSYGSRVEVQETLADGSLSTVEVAAGLVHRRSGERVRLKVGVTDRKGGVPDHPVVVSVSLEGSRAGSLSHVSSSSPCRQLTLLWSDPAGNGQRGGIEREFDLLLGADAGLAALVPDDDPARPLEAWWHRSGTLTVSIGRPREDGQMIEVEGDRALALRAEGPTLPAVNPLLAVVEKLREKGRTSAILDAEFEEESQRFIEDITQAFFVSYAPKESKDVIDATVISERESGERVDGVPVPMRRVPGTQIFVGPFRLAPEGHPDAKPRS